MKISKLLAVAALACAAALRSSSLLNSSVTSSRASMKSEMSPSIAV
jgi:hypothetical protein